MAQQEIPSLVGDADATQFEKVLSEVSSNPNVSSVVTMCTPSTTRQEQSLEHQKEYERVRYIQRCQTSRR
jgi:hypothetical protein